MRVLIVDARYHPQVADRMVDGATAALDQGLAQFARLSVPGVLELPGAVAMASQSGHFDGYVALGTVIGSGTVAETLYRQTCAGLMQLSTAGLALGNGVLLGDSERALLALAGEGDAGGDAARAALGLATLRERLALL